MRHNLASTGSISLTDRGESRRRFLSAGAAFGLGGLIPGIGSGVAHAAGDHGTQPVVQSTAGNRAVINIFLAGGPPQHDLWDMKPDAPAEIRGEFKPIQTNVSGIEISEVFPRLARMADKYTLIRSLVGAAGAHDAVQCTTGWPSLALRELGGRPSLGAIVTKLVGAADESVPAFVGLTGKTTHMPWADNGQPGFLGPAFAPFKPEGKGLNDLSLNGVSVDGLQERRQLLGRLDSMKREVDATGAMRGMDAFHERALGVLSSSRLLEALSLEREDPKTLERYGDGQPYQFQFDGAPTANRQLLVARRLVEAGVRCVSLAYGRWDAHSKNAEVVRDHGGKLDQALSALLEDLDTRGLLATTTVIVWGEFGRTPRINPQGGRDHWPQVASALIAGGGCRGGQVIGATNRLGEYALERPVHFQEVFATLYQNLGIDPRTTVLHDPSGRPQFLLDHREPIRELT